jgi:hypothetical protein
MTGFLDLLTRKKQKVGIVKKIGSEYSSVCRDDNNFTYYISRRDKTDNSPAGEFGHVIFQHGPRGNVGINGCQIGDVITLLIDRLELFQAGAYNTRENALTITKLQEALHWQNHRTLDRMKRGVEGTSKV